MEDRYESGKNVHKHRAILRKYNARFKNIRTDKELVSSIEEESKRLGLTKTEFMEVLGDKYIQGIN